MISLKSIKAILFCLFLFHSASAQRYNLYRDYQNAKLQGGGKVWQRISLAGIQHYATATLRQHYIEFNKPYVLPGGGTRENNYGPPVDTTAVTQIKTKGSWGMSVGSFFPITKMSESSILAINTDMLMNLLIFDVPTMRLSRNALSEDDAVGLMIGLPVSLDYKIGGEAILNKRRKNMFTFGLGVNPSLTIVTYTGVGKPIFKPVPFIKAEAGFLLGIAFKIRGTLYMGKMVYQDEQVTDRFTHGSLNGISYNDFTQLKMEGKPGVSLALVIMPFSWDWDNDYF